MVHSCPRCRVLLSFRQQAEVAGTIDGHWYGCAACGRNLCSACGVALGRTCDECSGLLHPNRFFPMVIRARGAWKELLAGEPGEPLDVAQLVAHVTPENIECIDAALCDEQRREVVDALVSFEVERRLGVLEWLLNFGSPRETLITDAWRTSLHVALCRLLAGRDQELEDLERIEGLSRLPLHADFPLDDVFAGFASSSVAVRARTFQAIERLRVEWRVLLPALKPLVASKDPLALDCLVRLPFLPGKARHWLSERLAAAVHADALRAALERAEREGRPRFTTLVETLGLVDEVKAGVRERLGDGASQRRRLEHFEALLDGRSSSLVPLTRPATTLLQLQRALADEAPFHRQVELQRDETVELLRTAGAPAVRCVLDVFVDMDAPASVRAAAAFALARAGAEVGDAVATHGRELLDDRSALVRASGLLLAPRHLVAREDDPSPVVRAVAKGLGRLPRHSR